MHEKDVRVDYTHLEVLAQSFDDEAMRVSRLQESVLIRLNRLRAGGWEGLAAEEFLRGMHGDIVPAVSRMQQALTRAAQTTRDISKLFHEAEIEAARHLQGGVPEESEGEGNSAPPPLSSTTSPETIMVQYQPNTSGEIIAQGGGDNPTQVMIDEGGCVTGLTVDGQAYTPEDLVVGGGGGDTPHVYGENGSYMPWSVLNTQIDLNRQDMVNDMQSGYDQQYNDLLGAVSRDPRIFADARWRDFVAAIGIDPSLEGDAPVRLLIVGGAVVFAVAASGGSAGVVIAIGGVGGATMVGTTGYAVLDELVLEPGGVPNDENINIAEASDNAHINWLRHYMQDAYGEELNDLIALNMMTSYIRESINQDPMPTISGATYIKDGEPHLIMTTATGEVIFEGPVSPDMALYMQQKFWGWGALNPCTGGMSA